MAKPFIRTCALALSIGFSAILVPTFSSVAEGAAASRMYFCAGVSSFAKQVEGTFTVTGPTGTVAGQFGSPAQKVKASIAQSQRALVSGRSAVATGQIILANAAAVRDVKQNTLTFVVRQQMKWANAMIAATSKYLPALRHYSAHSSDSSIAAFDMTAAARREAAALDAPVLAETRRPAKWQIQYRDSQSAISQACKNSSSM